MIDYAKRLGAALWYRWQGQSATNREVLYGGAVGLRILTFHDIPPRHFDDFQAFVHSCLDRFEIGVPEDADALVEGRWAASDRDRLLLTFDDGLSSQHRAAEWLADQGIRGCFFLVPSLLGRSVADFLDHHRRRGVAAFDFDPETRSLSRSQALEIAAMGHRLGAHNDAHRDLSELHDPDALSYEIDSAIEQVADLTGSRCEDFAIAFGQPGNLSVEATRYLLRRCRRVFSCVRGLNVPGKTPRFLLRGQVLFHQPPAFTRICIEGGADHLMAGRHAQIGSATGTIPPSALKDGQRRDVPMEDPNAVVRSR